jgi:hypothetical protein
MKNLLLTLALILSMTQKTKAESIFTITANDQNDVLASLPQNLMATFVDQGFKQKEISKGIFSLKINGLRCDSNSRDFIFPDSSIAGLPMVKCLVNTTPEYNADGKKIQEDRFIQSMIFQLENHLSGFEVTDCAMGGKCSFYIPKIECLIDLNQDEMRNAYSCKFTI